MSPKVADPESAGADPIDIPRIGQSEIGGSSAVPRDSANPELEQLPPLIGVAVEGMEPQQALEQIEPIVKRIVAGLLVDFPDAIPDVEQLARIKVWGSFLKSFDKRKGSLKAFARRIIRNVALDELRKLRRQSRQVVQLTEEIDTTDNRRRFDPAEDEALATLIEADLPPYLLRVFEAMQQHPTPARAADSLSMSRATYYRLSHRVRCRISEILKSRKAA